MAPQPQLKTDPKNRFKNGVYVFHEDGTPVAPSSNEGINIQAAWDHQNLVKTDNNKNRIKFAWDTYPRDEVSRGNLLKSFGLDPKTPAPPVS